MNEKKIKVLVVEDEILIAKCLSQDLEELGCNVLEPVTTGEEAIEVALREKPDLIFMDIQLLGEINGIEAARIIMEKDNIAICFISGYATEYIKQKTRLLNPAGFLEKPVTVDKMKEIINKKF